MHMALIIGYRPYSGSGRASPGGGVSPTTNRPIGMYSTGRRAGAIHALHRAGLPGDTAMLHQRARLKSDLQLVEWSFR